MNKQMDEDHHQLIYKIKKFDRRSVDLNKPATTVDEYMKQVVVSRESIPEVAVAKDVEIILKNQVTEAVKAKDPPPCTSRFVPEYLERGKNKWNMEKSNYFSYQRSIIESLEVEEPEYLSKLPSPGDSQMWRDFCFFKRPLWFLPPDDKSQKLFVHHRGIPPTLSLLKSISDVTVNGLIISQIDYVIKNRYKRHQFEWLYSLLLVVKKPLLHDVCDAMRKFARQCHAWRSKLDEDEMPRICEFTLFIAIISIYFGQKDLGDPEEKKSVKSKDKKSDESKASKADD